MRSSRRPAHPHPSRIGLLGGLVLAATAHPPVMLVGGVALTVFMVLVCVGVVMPAVWLRQPARRRDARAVLQQLLATLRPPRDP